MKKIPGIPKPSEPKLVDALIGDIQDALKANLSWLDYSFGRSQRLVTMKDGAEKYFPGIYLDKGDYINVFPNDQYGNFSFFSVEDPQEIPAYSPNNFNIIKVRYGLVIWYDASRIFSATDDRNTEALKADVLRVLGREGKYVHGNVTVDRIYDRAENIYRGYNLKEVDTQFLMYPYGGFRLEGELKYKETC